MKKESYGDSNIKRELAVTVPGRYPPSGDTTADAIYKDEPLAKSARKHIIQPTLYSGKGVIEHDSRKGQLAGEGEKIERAQYRNNEHINYEDGDKRNTWGG